MGGPSSRPVYLSFTFLFAHRKQRRIFLSNMCREVSPVLHIPWENICQADERARTARRISCHSKQIAPFSSFSRDTWDVLNRVLCIRKTLHPSCAIAHLYHLRLPWCISTQSTPRFELIGLSCMSRWLVHRRHL